MHKIVRTFSVLVLMYISSSALSEEIMYCTDNADQVIGFTSKNDWAFTRFEEARYTVKFSANYTQLQIGTDEYQCQKPYATIGKDGIVCQQNSGFTFIFNPKNKKYIKLDCSIFSYTSDVGDTCSLAQGTCVKF